MKTSIKTKITLLYTLIISIGIMFFWIISQILISYKLDPMTRELGTYDEFAFCERCEGCVIIQTSEGLKTEMPKNGCEYNHSLGARIVEVLGSFTDFFLLPITLIIAVFIILISAFVGNKLSMSILNPLEDVIEKINNVDLKNLKTIQLKSLETDDELQDLVEKFNEMIIRLNESYETQRMFIQDVNHELKTPLAVIQSNLELLEKDKTLSQKETQEVHNMIYDSLNRLSLLIKDFSLLNYNLDSFSSSKLSLKEEIIKSIDYLKPYTKKDNIKVSLNDDKSNKYIIDVNSELVNRMIQNLIKNAIVYNKKNGKVDIFLSKNSENITLTISDTGIGIKENDIKNIWKRFFRADESRSRDSGGSGLGLSIVKKIAEYYKIKIDINSIFNQGTSFILKIPINE